MPERVPGFEALPWPRRLRARGLAWLQQRLGAAPGVADARAAIPPAWLGRARRLTAPLRLGPSAGAELPLDSIFTEPNSLARPLPCAVSILLPVYGSIELVRRCARSIVAYTPPCVELVIVDDASPADGAAELAQLAASLPNARLYRNPRNLGFPATINRAFGLSKGELVVLLNSDAVVTPGWLTRLCAVHDRSSVGLVGPVSNDTGDVATIEASYHSVSELLELCARIEDQPERDVEKLSLFCALVSRAAFESVGGLDLGYGRGFFDDDDLCRALKARGLRVVLARSAFVHHSAGGSFRRLDPELYFAQFEVSRARFERKWRAPWRPALP